jgi:hypothetical protein
VRNIARNYANDALEKAIPDAVKNVVPDAVKTGL